MVYDKEKIKKIIEYKNNITDYEIKKLLNWLLSNYNNCFTKLREYKNKEQDYIELSSKYYNLEDEKFKLKKEIDSLKQQIQILKSKK